MRRIRIRPDPFSDPLFGDTEEHPTLRAKITLECNSVSIDVPRGRNFVHPD